MISFHFIITSFLYCIWPARGSGIWTYLYFVRLQALDWQQTWASAYIFSLFRAAIESATECCAPKVSQLVIH